MKQVATDITAGQGEEQLRYWSKSRSLAHGIICILPLLVLYQCGIVQGGHPERLIVEKWLAARLRTVGMASQITNIALLVALVAALWRTERSGRLSIHVLLLMPFEACLYALALHKGGMVLTKAIMDADVVFAVGLDRFAPYLLGLGAGVYEELAFRLVLLGGGGLALGRLFRWSKPVSYMVALVISSLLFSSVHHVGGSGEPLDAPVFLFRAVCGALLGLVFLSRGLGIAAWTHALYNVMVISQAPAA
jgi:membrane protease YdiL (CAAX protease family)